jgi:acyl-coenzyme A thioesterase PaaI-like protein
MDAGRGGVAAGSGREHDWQGKLESAGWTAQRDNAFFDLIGPIWRRKDADGSARFAILAREEHANRNGTSHGGLLLSFADQVMAVTAVRHNGGFPQATLQIDTTLTSAIQIGELIEAKCAVTAQTGSMMFMSGLFTVNERKVGHATAIFRVFRPRYGTGNAIVGMDGQ